MAPSNLHTTHAADFFNWVWDEATEEWVKMTQPGGTGGGDGAIVDGVSSAIKATVLDYPNSNPLAVRLTDANGDYAALAVSGAVTATPASTTISHTFAPPEILEIDVTGYATMAIQRTASTGGFSSNTTVEGSVSPTAPVWDNIYNWSNDRQTLDALYTGAENDVKTWNVAGFSRVRLNAFSASGGTQTLAITLSAAPNVASARSTTILLGLDQTAAAVGTAGDGTTTNTLKVSDWSYRQADADFLRTQAGVRNIAGIYSDALADVAAGKVGVPRITTKRGLHVNLRDSSGNEISPLTDTELRNTALSVVEDYATIGTVSDVNLTAGLSTNYVVAGGASSVRVTIGGGAAWTGTIAFTSQIVTARGIVISAPVFGVPVGGGPAVSSTTANGSWVFPAAELQILIIDGAAIASGIAGVRCEEFFAAALPALGQTTMAASQPVVIASNQTAVPVSGTVTATGPLTDTQLRATAVPVSGSVTVSPADNNAYHLQEQQYLVALATQMELLLRNERWSSHLMGFEIR